MRTVQRLVRGRLMKGGWVTIWQAPKGNGKGSTKGKGKNGMQGKGAGDVEGDWICKEVGCTMVQCNFSWRTHCFGCGCKHRSAAELQRARNAHVAGAKEDVGADGFEVPKKQTKKQKRKEKWELAKKEKQEKLEKVKPVAEGAQKAEAAGGAAAEVESDVSAKDLAKLGGAKSTTTDFKGLFFMPAPPKEGAKTAVEMVAEAAACRSAITLSTLEVRVARYKKYVELAKEDKDPENEKMMQTQLDLFLKEKATLEDKGVGGQVTVAKLNLLQQADATRATEKEQARTHSRAGRVARGAKLRAVLLAELAVAQKHIKDFDLNYTELTTAWTAEDSRVDKFYEDLDAAWTQRIEAAEAAAGIVAVVPSPPTPTPTPSVPAQTQMEVDEDIANKDELLETQWDAVGAPKITLETDEQKEFMDQLWIVVGEWHRVGRQQVLYRELVSTEHPQGMDSLKGMLGEKYWQAIYGNRVISGENAVPTQLKHILKEILMTLKIKKDAKDVKVMKALEDAKQMFVIMGSEKLSKRRRAEA